MTRNSSYPAVMGVYLGHDPACCLMIDGSVEFSIEEERLNRYKHGRPRALGGLWSGFAGRFGFFPWASFSYCLEAAELDLSDLDLIVLGDDQWAKDASETIQDIIPMLDKSKIVYADRPQDACHHFHHALASFYLSGFEEAAVLVLDGDGNVNAEGYEAETGFTMSRTGEWEEVFKNRYAETAPPRSGIGWMYEQVSYLLGYGNHEVGLAEPGKTMGLSSYGREVKALAEPWIEANGFTLDFSGFKRWLVQTGYDKQVFASGGLASQSAMPSTFAENLAYKVQAEAEDAILHLGRTLAEETSARQLCIGGGVALNSVANGKLAREKVFDDIHIIPAVHDGGQALGLAAHGHLLLTKPEFDSGLRPSKQISANTARSEIKPLRSAYLGREYSEEEAAETLRDHDLASETLSDQECFEAASNALAAGKIVGWFQGGSEIGPRALGNRSILSSPSFPDAKDSLNARVKFREGFRPFAPSVLAERAAEIFDFALPSPYMLFVAEVKDEWKERIPAVVHIDGTARLQTVAREANPRFHSLIDTFSAKTDVPVLLNTSFNLAGMPIVESPADAIGCFVQTQIDELYIGNCRITAPKPDSLIYSCKPGWEILVPAGNPTGAISVLAPDTTQLWIDVPEELVDCLRLFDGSMSMQEAIDRLDVPLQIVDEIDAVLKKLLRHGYLDLTLGSRTITNTRRDKNWHSTLYAAVAGA